MGVKKFDIKTYESFSGAVVEYKKMVFDKNGQLLTISPGKNSPTERGENSFSIDIHEIGEIDENKKPLREITNSISIQLLPDWINKIDFESKLFSVINKGEAAEDSLALSIRIVCPKINYVIESKKIPIREISERKPIIFKTFNLDDIVEKIEVQSEIVRTKSSNQTIATVAFSSHTILSRNRTITFYVDEIAEIGGKALPIEPGDTKDKMFVMKNLKKLTQNPPVLIYHKQFKNFFNDGDKYETVQTLLLLIGQPYCEQLLKWIVFGSPDYEKKEHKAIIKFIGEICDKRESELEKVTKEDDHKEKILKYLELSNLLFENIQNVGSGWKKMLYRIIQNEKK